VTDRDLHARAVAYVQRTRAEQGLPERVSDETALGEVAQIIVHANTRRARHTRRKAS
jgi:hypothetical protein